MRDFQKQRVYDWENEFIRPRAPRNVSFEAAQTFVDGIFLCERLLYPPKVRLMGKNATATYALGCREYIKIREVTPAWVIVHELAHTMTMDIDGRGDRHGPDFVGVYIKLLDSYVNVPLAYSMFTLGKTKVQYNLGAKPIFIPQMA